MNYIKQTDFKFIPTDGCLLFSILGGVQKFFNKTLAFWQYAYAYWHLVEQEAMEKDCYIKDHQAVGNLACTLLIEPDYEVLYIGKKDLTNPKDSWGQFFRADFTVLHGITQFGGHHFRLGDSAAVQIYDPFDPSPKIVGEASIRYYQVVRRKSKEGWSDVGASIDAFIPNGVVG